MARRAERRTAAGASENPGLGLGTVDAAAAVRWQPSQGETGMSPPPKQSPAKPAQHQRHGRKR
jgi:hypothetical protein